MNVELKAWLQMFFHDGSVSQGRRVDVEILQKAGGIQKTATELLNSLNRDSGSLLVWGAGNMLYYPRVTTSSLGESEISVSE